jgi:DNA (cytosine-5)-methyltransferase 1
MIGGGAIMGHARRPKAIDLYCGAGGMSLGFEQAGFDVVSAVEIDPVHAAVAKQYVLTFQQ